MPSEKDEEFVKKTSELTFLLITKQYSKALEIHNSIFDPKRAMDWYSRANILANLKQTDQALQCYDNALRLDSTYVKAWYRKGWIHFGQKDYALAYESFMTCILSEDKTTIVSLREETIPAEKWKGAAVLSAALALAEMRDPNHFEEFAKLMLFVHDMLLTKKIITEDRFPRDGRDSIKNGTLIDFIKQNWSEILDQLEPKTATTNIWLTGDR
jgi:tetratricopeptide (TPR) repeat protein